MTSQTRIHGADGFKRFTQAPVRIVSRGDYVEILEFDRGVWSQVYTTPFAVEVEVLPA